MFSEWSNPYPHLDAGEPRQNALLLQFREGAIRNERLSADGPSVYDRVFQVQVRAIGQKLSAPIYTLLKVTEGKEIIVDQPEYRRFKAPFDAWRQQIEPVLEGTPLEAWPLMTREIVRAYKDAGVHTVEHLADAPDTVADHVRGPFFEWRAKARAWLDQSKSTDDRKLKTDLAKAQEEIAQLKTQLAQFLAAQNGGTQGFQKSKRKRGAEELAPLGLPDEEPTELDDRL